MILKNAFLSIKKNIGKSILLFVIMAVIANLVMAGLSIRAATSKAMTQIRENMGSSVTLSYNMQKIMQSREKGESMADIDTSITIKKADLLKELDYVEAYNYTQSISVNSDDIEPVAMTASSSDDTNKMPWHNDENRKMDDNDFTVVGNTTMQYLSDFTDENYVLSEGRLLSADDVGTKNCVIETNLASDNDLSLGDTFQVVATDSDGNETTVKLKIVGIYEIKSTSQSFGNMSNRQSPYNTIYTSLETAQSLAGSTKTISSATYYIDDPEHIEAYEALAADVAIDWEMYALRSNDQTYEMSVSSLENTEKFATIFLWVVIAAGSVILALILILTLRSRFYEFGVLLSLGQSKAKIIGQQLLEVGLIAVLAFTLSLGTGKLVSNTFSHMLENSQNQDVTMQIDRPQMPGESEGTSDNNTTDTSASKNTSSDTSHKMRGMMNQAMKAPSNAELDVSMTPATIGQLAGITSMICVISVLLPSLYVLRLSPREILIKKEG